MEQKKIALAARQPDAELASWKDIAHYLGISVRTAQKWENERGLPILRVAGARSRVSATRINLDAWKERLAHRGKREHHCFCWPLGQELKVEVRFVGGDLRPAHLELLREYLNLAKTAL